MGQQIEQERFPINIPHDGKLIYTIGHSTRSIEEFLTLLEQSSIELLVDIRSIPRSRTFPQFNVETLPDTLRHHGIRYQHLLALGGRRSRSREVSHSPNTAWENLSFRNYADYALTAPFREGLAELEGLALLQRTCYMCSEAVWWRCHRRIVTDYLLVRGWEVRHIMGLNKVELATLNADAQPQTDGRILYPGDQQELAL